MRRAHARVTFGLALASRATVLDSNGDGPYVAVKDGRIAGVRGRAQDRVKHGRLGTTDLYGGVASRLAGIRHEVGACEKL